MIHRWAALVVVLALCATSPASAAAQTQSPTSARGRGAGTIGESAPNPFDRDTYMSFQVGADSCADGGRQYRVTLRILNVLGMPVAFFQLSPPPPPNAPAGAAAADTSRARPVALSNATLACGSYRAYWSGHRPNGKDAASGTYLVQLLVDDRLVQPVRKIYKSK